MVAAATQNLCDAANAMVQGHGSEEKLISARETGRQLDCSAARRLQGEGRSKLDGHATTPGQVHPLIPIYRLIFLVNVL